MANVLVTLFVDGEIWSHLEATFTAAVVGIVGGLLIGIVLGFGAALVPALKDRDKLVRAHAARALGRIGKGVDGVADALRALA